MIKGIVWASPHGAFSFLNLCRNVWKQRQTPRALMPEGRELFPPRLGDRCGKAIKAHRIHERVA